MRTGDGMPRWEEGLSQLVDWVLEGKLKHRETIVDNLENAPKALDGLFDGTNIGKLIVKGPLAGVGAPGGANEIKDRPSHGTVFSHACSQKFSQ